MRVQPRHIEDSTAFGVSAELELVGDEVRCPAERRHSPSLPPHVPCSTLSRWRFTRTSLAALGERYLRRQLRRRGIRRPPVVWRCRPGLHTSSPRSRGDAPHADAPPAMPLCATAGSDRAWVGRGPGCRPGSSESAADARVVCRRRRVGTAEVEPLGCRRGARSPCAPRARSCEPQRWCCRGLVAGASTGAASALPGSLPPGDPRRSACGLWAAGRRPGRAPTRPAPPATRALRQWSFSSHASGLAWAIGAQAQLISAFKAGVRPSSEPLALGARQSGRCVPVVVDRVAPPLAYGAAALPDVKGPPQDHKTPPLVEPRCATLHKIVAAKGQVAERLLPAEQGHLSRDQRGSRRGLGAELTKARAGEFPAGGRQNR